MTVSSNNLEKKGNDVIISSQANAVSYEFYKCCIFQIDSPIRIIMMIYAMDSSLKPRRVPRCHHHHHHHHHQHNMALRHQWCESVQTSKIFY